MMALVIFCTRTNKTDVMKIIYKISFVLIAILLMGSVKTIDAQSVQQDRKYRVIAYKKGDNAVFSVSNTTELTPYMSIYIPNSFTPNGDGLNDTFGIYGESVNDYNMQVFNRWGQVVFESNNVTERWDGTYNGRQVPQGAYVYRVTARGLNGKSTAKDGTVSIIY
jgi:gliding motility-associated-like protein